MERIKNAFKQFKIRDILAPFIFLFLLIPSLIFRAINKIKKRNLWLVAEDGEARDNGYHFYKYVREKHPKDCCFYAINKKSAGYENIKKLGNLINYGSLKHWLFYMSANLNISSQKGGNPCPIFWYLIHVTFGLYKNRVFLQHGVISNELKWLYYDKCKFKYFITSTKKEYNDIKEKYGYPEESVILTGLPRWDNLKNNIKEKTILIMPTWRKELGVQNSLFNKEVFLESAYYKAWNGLLNNYRFIKYIEDGNIRVFFYPHQRIQPVINLFSAKSKNIEIVSINSDIQKYMSECSLIITDYSSAVFDFAYLRKPVLYYQFDQKEFHEKQYRSGGFDYEKDGFGHVVVSQDDLIGKIKNSVENGMEQKYLDRIDSTFAFHDRNNSERIYNIIKDDKVDA